MDDVLLKVSGLKVISNQQVLLRDISFEVKKDETLAVIGPNGAGKTTLFRALLGLIPYEGKIEWKTGVKIGYVPQRLYIENDLPLTTLEFFLMKEKNLDEIYNALLSVGFEKHCPEKNHLDKHVLKKKLGVLSGGELQRVLIAWALLGKPEVLLFDEPTAGIDVSAEQSIYGLLHQLSEKENLTILLISHELQVVYKYANRVICLNKEKICFGPPREVLDKDSLNKLFGNTAGLYLHDHH